MSLPSVNAAFFQRLILAFTTGLFLSCAARVSASATEVPSSAAATSAR
jgi:hypothetical protein